MCIHHYVTTRGTTLISTTVTSCLKNKLYTSCIPIGLDVLSLYILQYISARGTNLVYYEVPYYIRNEIYTSFRTAVHAVTDLCICQYNSIPHAPV
jgi:hypothetical protein